MKKHIILPLFLAVIPLFGCNKQTPSKEDPEHYQQVDSLAAYFTQEKVQSVLEFINSSIKVAYTRSITGTENQDFTHHLDIANEYYLRHAVGTSFSGRAIDNYLLINSAGGYMVDNLNTSNPIQTLSSSNTADAWSTAVNMTRGYLSSMITDSLYDQNGQHFTIETEKYYVGDHSIKVVGTASENSDTKGRITCLYEKETLRPFYRDISYINNNKKETEVLEFDYYLPFDYLDVDDFGRKS